MQREFLKALNRPFGGDELFDEVFDTVYFVKDEAGRYIFGNETLVRRCGLEKKEDLLGRTAGEVFPKPLGQDFQNQDEEILAGGAAIRSQLERHIYPDGRQGWCLTWKRALRSAEGKIIGLSGISRDVDGGTSSAKDLESLSLVLEFIRENLDQPLRLSDLAEAADLSPYQVSQRLEGLMGLTPKQYISRCRIEGACHALETTDQSLSDISLACGFSDQSSFTRQFKQTVGMTPKVYRDRAFGSR